MAVRAECRQSKPLRTWGWQGEARHSNRWQRLVVTVILHLAKHGSWRQASPLFLTPDSVVSVSPFLSPWHLIGCGPGFTNSSLACDDSCAFFPSIREVRSGFLPYHTHARDLHTVDILFISIFILLSWSTRLLCHFVLSLCRSFSIHANWRTILAFFPPARCQCCC